MELAFAFTILVVMIGVGTVHGQLAQVMTASENDCATQCLLNPVCGSYSFKQPSSGGSGLCTMMAGSGQTVPAPSYGNAVVVYGTNAPANDMLMTQASDARNCREKCQANLNCNSFVWAAPNCWLKTSFGPVNVDGAATLGLMNRQGAKCVVLADANAPGSDIANFPASADACCDGCTTNPGCNSYSWANGHCWLKSTQGNVKNERNVWTGFPAVRAGI